MDQSELLTRWTVRIALMFYVAGLAMRISALCNQRQLAWARLSWTCGCLMFVAHVASAFQFYHHWSHAAAYEATAQRTREMTGHAWGGGIYANYAFALIWLADVFWWWLANNSYRARPRILEWSVQGFLAFIAFNATVVFGIGAIRWWGVGASLVLLAWLALVRMHSRSTLKQET